MAISIAAKYKENRIRKFDVPSGGEPWTLRKPGSVTIAELFDVYNIGVEQDEIQNMSTEELTEVVKEEMENKKASSDMLARVSEVLFRNCVMNPKIVFEETDNEDELYLEYVDPEDYMAILAELMEMIGVSPERIRELLFRGKLPIG